VEIGERTYSVIMEKNRMQLFRAVQGFLDETDPWTRLASPPGLTPRFESD